MDIAQTRVLSVDVHVITQSAAINEISEWIDRNEKGYVVTPNLSHCVRLKKDEKFKDSYASARLVLADGAPLVIMSVLGAIRLHRVTGSDLLYPLLSRAAERKHRVLFLGSTFCRMTKAAKMLSEAIGNLELVGCYSPSYQFMEDHAERDEVIDFINSLSPDIVIVALGAPKQEIWAHESISRLDTRAVLCLGASLDFYSGEVQRAPVIFRRLGLEWSWRIIKEPRRLLRRYLSDAMYLPALLIAEVFNLTVSRQVSYVNRRLSSMKF